MKCPQVTAIAGAGGKTTLIRRESARLRALGLKVLVTTTVHMMIERHTDLTCRADSLKSTLFATGICMAGAPCRDDPLKFSALPEEVYYQACQYADRVLVEADGARRLPAKFPREDEPALPSNVTDVIVVMGLDSLGKPIRNTLHRFGLMCQSWGISPDELITFSLLKDIVQRCYLTRLAAFPCRVLYSKSEGRELRFLSPEEAELFCEFSSADPCARRR